MTPLEVSKVFAHDYTTTQIIHKEGGEGHVTIDPWFCSEDSRKCPQQARISLLIGQHLFWALTLFMTNYRKIYKYRSTNIWNTLSDRPVIPNTTSILCVSPVRVIICSLLSIVPYAYNMANWNQLWFELSGEEKAKEKVRAGTTVITAAGFSFILGNNSYFVSFFKI